MPEVEKIAEEADLIVNGYSFKVDKNNVKILNLNNPVKALVVKNDFTILETTMDDIEIHIVKQYLERNKEFLEL